MIVLVRLLRLFVTTLTLATLQAGAELELLDPANTQRASKYPEITQAYANEVTNIINGLIERSKLREGTHPFLAGFVRLIFHDCVGASCDGCLNMNLPANKGLEPYLEILNSAYLDRQHRIFEQMSRADFWALTGIVAARKGAIRGGQMLTTKFRWGREDCPTSPETNVEDIYPDPHGGAQVTLKYWQDYFGLTYTETAALMGAHSLGKCHKDASGFEGSWTADRDTLDNAYYRDLVSSHLGWRQQRVDEDHVQWVHSGGSNGMMLNSDMALLKDIKPDPQVSNCGYSECGKSPTSGMVESFAKDNALFIREFSAVFQKLLEHGYSDLNDLGHAPRVKNNHPNPQRKAENNPKQHHLYRPGAPSAFTHPDHYPKRDL